MKKADFLKHWQEIKPDQNIKIDSIAYKRGGSTYDCDGIRLTGSTEFIDSVLSRLKDLLKHENGNTRLQVVYKQSTDRHTQQLIDGYNCYIQVHERGGEAKIVNAMFGKVSY